MDEYQYDELSMAIGFAHFASEMAAHASPMRSPMLRPASSPRQRRSLRWQNSGHFHLSRTNSYQDHDHFPSIVPEYVEESVLERLQVEIDVIEEEEGSPPIIDGPVYTDDEVLKLDLFHRSRSNTVSGSSKNGAFEGYFPSSPYHHVIDINLPSGRSSRSSNGKAAEDPGKSKSSTAEPAEVPENATTQKAQIRNLLMGIAGRQPPTEPVEADSISPVSGISSITFPAEGEEQKAQIKNKLLVGLTAQISAESRVATKPNADSDKVGKKDTVNNSEVPADSKAQIKNALLAGLTARRKPDESPEGTSNSNKDVTSAINSTHATPTNGTAADSVAPVGSGDSKAQIKNALLAGLTARRKPDETPEGTSNSNKDVTSATYLTHATPNKGTAADSVAPVGSGDSKAQIKNALLAGLTARRKPDEASEVTSPSADASAPSTDSKAQVRNMLMAGLASRQKPTEVTETNSSAAPPVADKQPPVSSETSAPPAEQKAQIKNMLLAGLASRQKPVEPSEATTTPNKAVASTVTPNKEPSATPDAPSDSKVQIKNALLAGLAARQKPTEPSTVDSTLITPKKETPTSEASAGSSDQKAQVRNMLMAGLAARQRPAELTSPTTTNNNTATETDTWSPALRALPPLPVSPLSPPIPPAQGSLK